MMHTIMLPDYYMGRDAKYAGLLTDDLRKNAFVVVAKANTLLTQLLAANVPLETSPTTHTLVSSGWRPAEVNAATPNASTRSKHLTCQAIDIYDPEGLIDDWCMDHLHVLEAVELWMENPAATKGWAHWQIIPPKSGKRVFFP